MYVTSEKTRDYAGNIVINENISINNGDFQLIQTFYNTDDLTFNDCDGATGANICLHTVNDTPATAYILNAVYSYLYFSCAGENLTNDRFFISLDDYTDYGNTCEIIEKIKSIIDCLEYE